MNLRSRHIDGIQSRIVLLLLVLLVPIILVQTLIFFDIYQTRRAMELQASLEIAGKAGEAFNRFIKGLLYQELTLGMALASENLSPGEGERILRASRVDHPAVRNFAWVNPEGRIVLSSLDEPVDLDLSGRDYIRRIMGGEAWIVSDILVSLTTHDPIFTVSRGIRDEAGNLLGIVVATIVPERLDEVFRFERKGSGAIVVTDRKGMGVYRHPALEDWNWERRNLLPVYPVLEQALKGVDVTGTTPRATDGERRMFAVTPIRSIGWTAGASRAEEEALAPIISYLLYHTSFFFFAVISAFLVALALARKITRPVNRMQRHALSLGRGARETLIDIGGPREVRDLVDALNTMVREIESRETTIGALADEAQKKAEAAELEHRRLRAVLDALPVGVFIADSVGRIEEMNTAAQSIWGGLAPRSERPARYGEDYKAFSPRTGKRVEAHEWGLSRALTKGETCIAEEVEIECFDGSRKSILNYALPIRGVSGEIVGGVALDVDITERKRAEETLRKSEERFRELADSMPQLVWTAGPDGTVDYYNRRHREFAGIRSSGKGWEWAPVVHPDDLGPTITAWEGAVANGKIYEIEHRVRQADGSYRWYLSRGVPVRSAEGHVTRWYGTATDVDARKRAEEALQKAHEELELRILERTAELEEANRSLQAHARKLEYRNRELEEFAFITSHDLREPIRKVQTFGNILEQRYGSALDESGRGIMGRLIGSVKRMDVLLQALLQYSQVVRSEVHFSSVRLEPLIRDVLEDLSEQLRETGAVVEVSELPEVEGNPAHLRQLFQNLIENALKYNRGKRPHVRIHASETRDGYHQIYVSDNGIGFDEKYTDRIFKPFQRLHYKESPYDGTGIGLAICRKVAEHHGGEITARSTPGEGSTFTVKLPGVQTGKWSIGKSGRVR